LGLGSPSNFETRVFDSKVKVGLCMLGKTCKFWVAKHHENEGKNFFLEERRRFAKVAYFHQYRRQCNSRDFEDKIGTLQCLQVAWSGLG